MMSWVDDSLPLPTARPVEGEEALEAAIHALAALATGIAAMQLLTAVVLGQAFSTLVFSTLLVATAACAFVDDRSRLRRAAYLVGGIAATLVWLTLLSHASGQGVAVVLVMAGIAAAITRQLVARGAPDSRDRRGYEAADLMAASSPAWIEDDREGRLAA